jgi:hypothetical protein
VGKGMKKKVRESKRENRQESKIVSKKKKLQIKIKQNKIY